MAAAAAGAAAAAAAADADGDGRGGSGGGRGVVVRVTLMVAQEYGLDASLNHGLAGCAARLPAPSVCRRRAGAGPIILILNMPI